MEVLRDHLLGVSESGKVSGRAAGRTPSGGQTGGRHPVRCAAGPGVRSVRGSERCGSGVELECLAFGECQKNSGARFVSGPGSNVFPEAGSLGVPWVGQPFRLQWKGEQSYTLANLKEIINKPNMTSFILVSPEPGTVPDPG